MTTTELETLIVRLVGNSTSYLKMLGQAQRATATFAASVRQTMSGLQMTVALPLAAIGAAAVKQFANFDKAIVESYAIVNATEEQITKMKNAALDLATKGIHGPTELAKAFYHLMSTGMNAEQAIKALPVVSKFSTAGVIELSKGVDYLAGSVNALGMDSKDPVKQMAAMTRVGNALVKVSHLAIGTTEDFGEALTNNAAQAMNRFNISLEDGLAVLGAYHKQQYRGKVAGSMMDRMLRLITAAAGKNKKAFKDLGISIFDPNTGDLRGPLDIVKDMAKVLGGLSHEGQGAALSMLGIEAKSQHAIFPLINTTNTLSDLRGELNNLKGVMNKISNTQLEAFSNQMRVMGNTVIVLAIKVGEILAPILLTIGEGVKWLTKQFLQLSPSTQRIIVLASALAATLIIVTAAVSVLAFIFGGMIATLLPPLVAIVGIAAYLAYLEQTTGGVTKAWEYLQKVGVKVWASLVKVFTQLAAEAQPVIDAIVEVTNAVGSELQKFVAETQVELEKLWKEIGQDIKDIWEWTTPLRIALLELVSVLIRNVAPVFLWILKSTLKLIKDIIWAFDTVHKAARGAMESIEAATGVSWAAIQETVLTAIATIEFGIINFGRVVDVVFNTMGLGLLRVGSSFTYLFGTAIPHLVIYFKEYAIAVFDAVFDYIKQFTINSINLLANIPNIVPELIAKVGTGKELRKALEMAFGAIIPNKLDIKLPKLDIPKKIDTPLEKQMLEMIQEQLKGLDVDLDKFIQEKLKKYKKPLPLKGQAGIPKEAIIPELEVDWFEELGKRLGKALGIGMSKEMDKFQVPDRWEGVLADSVKGMIELQEYRKRIFGGRFLPTDDKLPKDKPIRPLLPPPGFGPGSELDFRPFNPEPPTIPKPPKIDIPWTPPDAQFPPFDLPNVPDVEIKPGLAKYSPMTPNMGSPLKGIEEFLKDNLSKMSDRSPRPIPVQVATTSPTAQGLPNSPDVKEVGNKLVTRDERVPGLLEEILRELKLSNKNNKLKIGGGLS